MWFETKRNFRRCMEKTKYNRIININRRQRLNYIILYYINIENIILDPGRGRKTVVVVITSLSSDLRLQRQSDEPTIARRCLIMKRAVY